MDTTYRTVIFLLVFLTGFITFLWGEKSIWLVFRVFILSFGLGYRTVKITEVLKLHPSELLLWMLCFVYIIYLRMRWKKEILFYSPLWLKAFFLFMIWGLLNNITLASWDAMFSEFRIFLLFFPLFLLMYNLLDSKERFDSFLKTFFILNTYLSVMGTLEFFVPGVKNLLPGFISDVSKTTTGEGFLRAAFSFWGGPAATFSVALSLPVGCLLLTKAKNFKSSLIVTLMLCLHLVGIYIGGYRSIWLVSLIELILIILTFKIRPAYLIAVIILGIVAYHSMPSMATERAATLILALERRPIDTSAEKRIAFTNLALEGISVHPLGVGWGGAGWVHNDFLHIALNLGVMAVFVFIGGYIFTLRKVLGVLLRCQKGSVFRYQRNRAACIFVCLVGAGLIMFFEGVDVLPQLAMPVWFILVLSDIFHKKKELFKSENPPEDISSASGV